ncbi:MAG TPA: hypothetical protein PKM63_12535 [Panacibacter sp.]|nr:hypothetical protein [Panacibacter sp.]HNP45108.1 hypothetical protein [Panacibacter sp.]
MARVGKNSPLNDLSGQLGKQLVLKQYADKTVVSAYPDMSKVKPTGLQLARRAIFGEAVAYAKAINNNPTTKAEYLEKLAPGQTVYHFAMQEYFTNHP